MDDSSRPSSSSAPLEESTTQKQARLRRERRETKIKAGGSARLDKITSLSGRPVESEIPTTTPIQPTSFPTTASGLHGSEDPDEVDISQHFYTPGSNTPRSRQVDAERQFQQLQQMMGKAPPPNTNMQDNPFAMPGQQRQQQQQQQQQGGMGAGGGEEDPMLRMLQQMMGGMPGGAAVNGGADGLPPGLAAMFGGGAPQAADGNKYSYIWKIVHAIFALTLGVYVTAMTTFTGSRFSRTTSFIDGAGVDDGGARIFWVFATAELVLQSTRFFIEQGRTSQSGVLGMVAGFLPEPWKGYVGLVGRYSGIWNTVVEDAMVVVFVLGVVAWSTGGVS